MVIPQEVQLNDIKKEILDLYSNIKQDFSFCDVQIDRFLNDFSRFIMSMSSFGINNLLDYNTDFKKKSFIKLKEIFISDFNNVYGNLKVEFSNLEIYNDTIKSLVDQEYSKKLTDIISVISKKLEQYSIFYNSTHNILSVIENFCNSKGKIGNVELPIFLKSFIPLFKNYSSIYGNRNNYFESSKLWISTLEEFEKISVYPNFNDFDINKIFSQIDMDLTNLLNILISKKNNSITGKFRKIPSISGYKNYLEDLNMAVVIYVKNKKELSNFLIRLNNMIANFDKQTIEGKIILIRNTLTFVKEISTKLKK